MEQLEIRSPLDFLKISLEDQVVVLCNHAKIIGKLYSFDMHLNILLGDVIETRDEQTIKHETLFVRGDMVRSILNYTEKAKTE
eukprot:gnl/Chilomastix_caulleri/896.p1 GENE.gnl/Chilomastix_caulleri/896~~gnl/Chilomastix_caulleri/896.p1  ORF type:complete len:83 (+),score=3.63 gnl/Chilomastix_caulleri/896:13-261(+)